VQFGAVVACTKNACGTRSLVAQADGAELLIQVRLRKIVLTVQIPVFADADTGYGDAISTHYTVREYIQAGIAGAHIEDQTFPPKSGPRRRCISSRRL
jgi:2-methylisocitrate lyase-like PEP mutase family enzyme